MKVSPAGIALIARYEGFSAKPYQLGDGKTTIGYGETQGITMRTGPWTEKYARQRLVLRVNRDYGAAVDRFLRKHGIKVTQNQFDALASLAYNLGVNVFVDGAATGQTMRNALKAGVVRETTFTVYSMPGSKFHQGLLRRRKAEWALFSKRPALTKQDKWRAELAHRRAQLRVEKAPGARKYLIRRINDLKRALTP